MEGNAQWLGSCEEVCGNLTPLSNSNSGERRVGNPETIAIVGVTSPYTHRRVESEIA
jgi:hypothetical protein